MSARQLLPVLIALVVSSVCAQVAPDAATSSRIGDLIRRIDERTGYAQSTRFPSVEELVKIGAPAVPQLIAALTDRTRDRSHAAQALGRIGPAAAEAVPALQRLLDHEPHRWDAVDALGSIGPAASPAVPRLIRILRESRGGPSSLDQIAARALGRLGDRAATPVLIEALQTDSKEFLQGAAAEALGALRDPAALPSLAAAYRTRNRFARLAVVSALGAFEHPAALPPLVAGLHDDSDTARFAAFGALRRVGSKLPQAALTAGLAQGLAGQPATVRQAVIDVFEDAALAAELDRRLPGPPVGPSVVPTYAVELESTGPIRHAVAAIDGRGNVLILGPGLSRIGPDGVRQWSTPLPDLIPSHAIAVDPNGNTLVAGVRGERRAHAFALVDASGRTVRAVQADAVASPYGRPVAAALAPDGSVRLLGTHVGPQVTDRRIASVHFGAGGELGRGSLGDAGDAGTRYAVPGRQLATRELLAVDAAGRAYALLEKFFARSEPAQVLARFDAEGTLDWMAPCEGFEGLGPSTIRVGDRGEVYLAGKGANANGRIVKIGTDGRLEWSRDLPGAEVRGFGLARNGDLLLAWNRWPSRSNAQVATMAPDGSLRRIDTVSLGARGEGTGFVVDLAAGAPGTVALVVQWQQVKTVEASTFAGSSGSRLLSYALPAGAR